MLATTHSSYRLQQHNLSTSWCKLCGPAALKAVTRAACVQLDSQWAAVRARLCSSRKPLTQSAAFTDPPLYNRPHLEQLFSRDPGLAVMRAAQVLLTLLKLLLLHVQHAVTPADAPSKASRSRQAAITTASYAADVRNLLSELGVLWVKIGQTLSVRPDLVGHQLAAALAGLQESAPPFDNAEALRIIQWDLGCPASEMFSWMSPDPVASASLGQVYQAKLAVDGRLVAVKVQRPRVWEKVQADLAILLLLLKLLKATARIKQDITLWADTLGNGLAQEVDYVQEAHNLELFGAAHSHLDFLTVPEVVWQVTSRRVLTTTWVEGNTPGQMLRQARRTERDSSLARQQSQRCSQQQHYPKQSQLAQQPTVLPTNQEPQQQEWPMKCSNVTVSKQQLLQLVTMGIEATLCQLVVTGVLHSDPHPGNLLLTPGGQLAYLDFGLLVEVPGKAQLAMMSALMHWALADWRALANDLGNMGLLKDSTDRALLAVDLQQRFSQLHSGSCSSNNSTTSGGCAVTMSNSGSASDERAAAGAVPPRLAADAARLSNIATQQRAEGSSVPAAANTGQRPLSQLLLRAGSISFGDFAGVIAALAVRYRFELPPYYTLVIRSLTTLEGFALSVDPSTRYDIAQAAVRVVARQLLEDRRPEAQQLLLQVLQDPQQPGQLNVALFEELLLLRHHQHQHQPKAATAEHNLPGQVHTVRTAVGGTTQQLQQSRSSITSAQPRLLGTVVNVLQQLDASQIARQLSGRHAKGVRQALAQCVVSCWMQQLARQQQGIPLSTEQVCRAQDATPNVLAGGGHARCRDQLQDMYSVREGSRTEKTSTLIIVAARWLMRAGWRGVVVVWQLVSCCTVLLARRLLGQWSMQRSHPAGRQGYKHALPTRRSGSCACSSETL